ncbi:MAG: C-GCAxxG-C-C family protein [Promethearchaeota archaeon]
MSNIEKAVSCFLEGFTCAQAILSTYGTQYGINRKAALRLGTGFGGGIARFGKTCGAVTGAFMVIGLKYGRETIEDLEAKEKTYKFIREFVNQFQSINGSIICRELLGCDINTPEGREYAEKNDLFIMLCPKFVKSSSEILENLL